MSYPSIWAYLHVCPQSMKKEGVEVEYAALAGQGLTRNWSECKCNYTVGSFSQAI